MFGRMYGRVSYSNADETTAVGEPMPGPEGRRTAQSPVAQGTSLLGLVGVGAGVGLVFAVFGRLF